MRVYCDVLDDILDSICSSDEEYDDSEEYDDYEEEKSFNKELSNKKTGQKLSISFYGSGLEIVKVNGQEPVADGKRDDKRKVWSYSFKERTAYNYNTTHTLKLKHVGLFTLVQEIWLISTFYKILNILSFKKYVKTSIQQL